MMPDTKLAGVWELVSETLEGLAIMTETHFCEVITVKDREKYAGDQPGTDEAAGLYAKIGRAAAGTYDIADGEGTELHVYSKDPNAVGRSVHFGFTVDETNCSFWQIQPDGSAGPAINWRRVG
jgi:hypothetical protein